MKKFLVFTMMFLAVATFSFAQNVEDDTVHIEKKQAAVEAAVAWLALVDNKEYEKSWEETAEFFRRSVTKADWPKTLEILRTPLGKVSKREAVVSEYFLNIPNAPEGEYVVIQFKTDF